jgi:LysR family transcriptional regulator, nod-box dependent transcriptional activator
LKNLRQINLNSLPMLREILRQGSITKAAAVLNITPPALSNTLRLMRGYFGDELIERKGQEMILTPRAQRLLQGLETALSSVEGALFEQNFDPEKSDAQFHIAMTDHSMALLSGPLTNILGAEAPLLQIRFTGISRTIVADFNSDKIDMVLTPRAQLGYGHFDPKTLSVIRSETLFTEPLVAIARADDAGVSAGISTEEYLRRPHIGYYQNTEPHTSIEQVQLAALGLKQHDRLLLTSYMQLPYMVAETGCIGVVPRSIAIHAARMVPIQIFDPPMKFPSFELAMLWHENNEVKLGSIWLRGVLKRCIHQVNAEHDLQMELPT